MQIPAFADYPPHVGSCPDCGNDGPHTVQADGFGALEFQCADCGMIHECPMSYTKRVRRERATLRAFFGRK